MGQYQSSERTYQDEIRRLQIQIAASDAHVQAQRAAIDVQKAAADAQRAAADARKAAIDLHKAAADAQKADIVFNVLLFGAAALFFDHLLRGTRFGRKFCVKSRLRFSPSHLFQPKGKKLIADEYRAEIISDSLSVPLPAIVIR